MLDSVVLDVVIGLILLYLLLSVAVSAFNELAEGLLKRRSKYLLRTFERLGGDDLVDELYQTSWIRSLSGYAHSLRTQQLSDMAVRNRQPFGEKKPSYIPVDIFIEALREMLDDVTDQAEAALVKLDEGGTFEEIAELLPPRIRRLLPEGAITASELREEIERLVPAAMKEISDVFPVGVLDDIEDDALKLRQWFEHTMDRMSGWYGRQTKWLLMVWGVVFALMLNIDTFNVAGTLWSDDVARAAAVAAAGDITGSEELPDCEPEDENPYSCVDAAVAQLKGDFNIPMGWPGPPWKWDDPATDSNGDLIAGMTVGDDGRIPQGASAWIYRLLGILATGAAVAMGAPFWFNLLNKFVNFRAAGPKPERTATEVVVS